MVGEYPLGVLWQQYGLGSFAAAGAMLGISMMALGWMAAYFLQDERLKAWVKTELLKVGFSILIILAALAFFSSGAVEKALYEALRIPDDIGWRAYQAAICADTTPPCHVALGLDYLDTIYKTARNLNREQFVIYSNFAMLSNIGGSMRGWPDFFIMAGFNPFIALSLPQDTISISFDLTIKMMMATRFLEYLVDISYASIFPTFLILGLVLRMFFFSRKLGGMLVALALALYLVLPSYFAMMDYALYKISGRDAGAASDGVILGNRMDASAGSIDALGSGRMLSEEEKAANFNEDGTLKEKPNLQALCTEMQNQQAGESKIGVLTAVSNTVLGSFTKGFVRSFSTAVFGVPWENDPLLGKNGMLDNVGTLLVYAVIVPFLGLMIMLASVKVFSPLIGGDVEIAGISRLL